MAENGENYEGGHNLSQQCGKHGLNGPQGQETSLLWLCPLISHLFDLIFKLPPLLLPFDLFLSRELSGPSQSSRNPEALSTSAQHSLPFLQPPTSNTTSCRPGWHWSPAEMDSSFNPGNHKHTGQKGPRTDPWEGEWLSPWRRGDACLHLQNRVSAENALGWARGSRP